MQTEEHEISDGTDDDWIVETEEGTDSENEPAEDYGSATDEKAVVVPEMKRAKKAQARKPPKADPKKAETKATLSVKPKQQAKLKSPKKPTPRPSKPTGFKVLTVKQGISKTTPIPTTTIPYRTPGQPITATEFGQKLTQAEAACKAEDFKAASTLLGEILDRLHILQNRRKASMQSVFTIAWYTQEEEKEGQGILQVLSPKAQLERVLKCVSKTATENNGASIRATQQGLAWKCTRSESQPGGDADGLNEAEQFVLAHTNALYPSAIKSMIERLATTTESREPPAPSKKRAHEEVDCSGDGFESIVAKLAKLVKAYPGVTGSLNITAGSVKKEGDSI